MYLISTSFHTSKHIVDEIKEIVRKVYIPMLEKAEIFHNIRMLRIMVEIDPETRSFAVQYETEDIEKANQWSNQDAKKLFGILHNRYGEKLVHFTTPMEIE